MDAYKGLGVRRHTTRAIGYDAYHGAASQWLTYTDLETIYRECDIITVHLNLNEQTRHMINRDAIARMKDGVILINCGRISPRGFA